MKSIKIFTYSAIILLSTVFLVSITSAASKTFTKTSIGRVEISPAIKGTVCNFEGDQCVAGTQKTIIFGGANLYSLGSPVPQKLGLLIFDDKLIAGFSNSISMRQDSIAAITEDNLSTLGTSGNETKIDGKLAYNLNINTGNITDLEFFVEGKHYKLTSTEKVLQIIWTPSSDSISIHPAKELLTVFLRPQNNTTAAVLKGNSPFSANFFYNLSGSEGADISIDYGDGSSQSGLKPTIAGLLNHVYQNEGNYKAFITVKYPSGRQVKSNIITISTTKGKEFLSFEETGRNPFSPQFAREYPGGLESFMNYFKFESKPVIYGPPDTLKTAHVEGCIWNNATQQCTGKYITAIDGQAPLDVFLAYKTSQDLLSADFDFGNGIKDHMIYPFLYPLGTPLRMKYDKPGTYSVVFIGHTAVENPSQDDAVLSNTLTITVR